MQLSCLAILLRHKLHEKLPSVTYPLTDLSHNFFIVVVQCSVVCDRCIGRENPKHRTTIQFYYDDGLTRWENENKIHDYTTMQTIY